MHTPTTQLCPPALAPRAGLSAERGVAVRDGPTRGPAVIGVRFPESLETQHEATENEGHWRIHGLGAPLALRTEEYPGGVVSIRGPLVGTSDLGRGERPG